tara:strand:- start:1749 stop:2096 length:348 start_codon:yes stop_codon:yes gene_type:complete
MSKIVKIMSIKSIKNQIFYGSRSRFIEYTNRLSETAKNQKGFISSNSYWKNNLNTHEVCEFQIVSISNWNRLDDWNNWLKSKERKEVSDRFKEIKCDEKFDILLKKKNNDDIFLL